MIMAVLALLTVAVDSDAASKEEQQKKIVDMAQCWLPTTNQSSRFPKSIRLPSGELQSCKITITPSNFAQAEQFVNTRSQCDRRRKSAWGKSRSCGCGNGRLNPGESLQRLRAQRAKVEGPMLVNVDRVGT